MTAGKRSQRTEGTECGRSQRALLLWASGTFSQGLFPAPQLYSTLAPETMELRLITHHFIYFSCGHVYVHACICVLGYISVHMHWRSEASLGCHPQELVTLILFCLFVFRMVPPLSELQGSTCLASPVLVV